MEPDSVSFASWPARGTLSDIRGSQRWLAESPDGWTVSGWDRLAVPSGNAGPGFGGEVGIISTRNGQRAQAHPLLTVRGREVSPCPRLCACMGRPLHVPPQRHPVLVEERPG